jgi:putative zinc finger protein
MHPTERQIEAYARRTLAPADLLALDDHLAACDECRRQAAARAGLPAGVESWRAELLPLESHLSDEDVLACATGGPDATPPIDAHLRACGICARAVADLRAHATGRRPWFRYAAAAAAIVAVGMSAWLWRTPPGAVRPPDPLLAGLEALPPDAQARVRAALRAGVAAPPAVLTELGTASETLMAPRPSPGTTPDTFRLRAPVATITVSDQPAFRWEPLAGADDYTVLVSDERLQPVARSTAVSSPEWTAEPPLPRGRVYLWQVTARRGGQSVSAPVPPAPPARFAVMSAEEASLLEEVTRRHPGSHLLAGILYAQAGARAEAEAQLALVPRTDPGFATAERTLAQLRGASSAAR